MHTARLISEGTLELLVGPVVRFEFNFKVTKQITQTVHTTLMHTLYIHATRGIHAITVIRTRYRIGDRVENTAVHSPHVSCINRRMSRVCPCLALTSLTARLRLRANAIRILDSAIILRSLRAFARRKDRPSRAARIE